MSIFDMGFLPFLRMRRRAPRAFVEVFARGARSVATNRPVVHAGKVSRTSLAKSD
jgi:hypothetical protein